MDMDENNTHSLRGSSDTNPLDPYGIPRSMPITTHTMLLKRVQEPLPNIGVHIFEVNKMRTWKTVGICSTAWNLLT